ncbi:MAG: hypothetical protein Q9226_003266, partial [Calogaya cf. arnoldii]
MSKFSAASAQLAAPEEIEYTVFPLKPQTVALVDSKIKAFAIKDTVRTITDPYRPQFRYVLYWQLRATEITAAQLQTELVSDAYLFKTTGVGEQAELQLAGHDPGSNMMNTSIADGQQQDQYRARQRSPPEDLKVVSWAPGQILATLRDYDFQLGIDKWFYSPNVKAQRKDTPTDSNPKSHGSCVFSKAIGLYSGVYKNKIGPDKNSKVVVVKVDRALPLSRNP